MTERTLVLFKPDIYETDLVAVVVHDFQGLGMSVVEHFTVNLPYDGIFYLWPRIFGRRWITNLMKTMSERVLDVYVLQGKDAIEQTILYKDQLRTKSAKMNSHRNLIHSSDSKESFSREYQYLKSISGVEV